MATNKQQQVDGEKLKVLDNIFGKDLTSSVIGTVLRSHDNKFDDTVDTLLSMTNNTSNTRPNTFNAQEGPEVKEKEDLKHLHNMFGGELTQSVIATVYDSSKGDVSETVDTLLNITSKDLASGGFKEHREAEAARLEVEIHNVAAFNKLQHDMQEEAKRLTEEAQKAALARSREEERIRNEERIRKEEEHKKIMIEQERLLKAYEDSRRTEQERKSMDAAQRAQAEAVERSKAAEEAKRAEELRRMAAERRQLEEERLRMEMEKQALEMRRAKETEERLNREKEEKRRQEEAEMRTREEEKIKKAWEDRLRQIEAERKKEEELRKEEKTRLQEKLKMEAARREEEQRLRIEEERLHQEEERLRLELDRVQLEAMRKRVEEDKRNAEEKIKQLEADAKRREDEEQARKLAIAEEEKRQEEEERQRHEEEQARIAKQQALVDEERKKKQAEDSHLEASIIVISPPHSPVNQVDSSEAAPPCAVTFTVVGDVVSGTWTLKDETSATPTDWLALFNVSQPANTKYTQYMYTRGVATGQFIFKGVTPGHYDIRFFPNKTYEYTARTSAIRVGPAAAVTAQLAGEQLKVQYTFFPTSSDPTRDWVGIYEKTQRRNKKYIACVYGNTSGEVTLRAPRQPGTYEARVFVSGSSYNDQARVEFTVEDHDSISVAPDVVQTGSQISAVWTMMTHEPSTSDWVGMFKTDETNNTRYIASAYTQGASVGSVLLLVPKDLASGMYELRLFTKATGKYTTFKTSPAFTVTQ